MNLWSTHAHTTPLYNLWAFKCSALSHPFNCVAISLFRTGDWWVERRNAEMPVASSFALFMLLFYAFQWCIVCHCFCHSIVLCAQKSIVCEITGSLARMKCVFGAAIECVWLALYIEVLIVGISKSNITVRQLGACEVLFGIKILNEISNNCMWEIN